MSNIKIHSSWLELLNPAFQEDSFQKLKEQLLEERAAGIIHYPPGSQIFNAFNKTPLNDVKVVILGQDYKGFTAMHAAMSSCFEDGEHAETILNMLLEAKGDFCKLTKFFLRPSGHFNAPSAWFT